MCFKLPLCVLVSFLAVFETWKWCTEDKLTWKNCCHSIDMGQKCQNFRLSTLSYSLLKSVNSSSGFIDMKPLSIKVQCFLVYIFLNIGFWLYFSESVSFIEDPDVECRVNCLHVLSLSLCPLFWFGFFFFFFFFAFCFFAFAFTFSSFPKLDWPQFLKRILGIDHTSLLILPVLVHLLSLCLFAF